MVAFDRQPRDFLGRWAAIRNSTAEVDELVPARDYYAGATWDMAPAPRDPASLYRFWTDPELEIPEEEIRRFTNTINKQSDAHHRLFMETVFRDWREQKDGRLTKGELYDRGDRRAVKEAGEVERRADEIWFAENAPRVNPNTAEVVWRSSRILWQAQLLYDPDERAAVRDYRVVMPVRGNPEVTIGQVEARYHAVEEYTAPIVPGVTDVNAILYNEWGQRANWDYPSRLAPMDLDADW